MSESTGESEAILPRLLASNALRTNLDKHMTLNQMADSKASMVMTAASLVMTVTLTQYARLDLPTVMALLISGLLAILFSIFAIIPPLHAKGQTNLFYFRSFAEISEEAFIAEFKECLADKERLYQAYLHEIYYLGKHRLTRKYNLVRNCLWSLLIGLFAAATLTLVSRLG